MHNSLSHWLKTLMQLRKPDSFFLLRQFEKSRVRSLVLALATAALAACGGAWAAENSPNAEGWAATCPAGFAPQAGLNSGFHSDDAPRQFHVLLPDDLSTPRPVFVALTGTVQPEPAFLRQSGLDQLPDSGWIVIAPVRTCATQGKPLAKPLGSGLVYCVRGFPLWRDEQLDLMWGSRRALFESRSEARCVRLARSSCAVAASRQAAQGHP